MRTWPTISQVKQAISRNCSTEQLPSASRCNSVWDPGDPAHLAHHGQADCVSAFAHSLLNEAHSKEAKDQITAVEPQAHAGAQQPLNAYIPNSATRSDLCCAPRSTGCSATTVVSRETKLYSSGIVLVVPLIGVLSALWCGTDASAWPHLAWSDAQASLSDSGQVRPGTSLRQAGSARR